MDKIGPLCRSAEDCAIVFDIIRGADPLDRTTRDARFVFDNEIEPSGLRVGYFKEAFDQDYRGRKNDLRTVKELKALGIKLEEVTFPDDLPVNALRIILNAEAAAAFDDLTRSDRDTLLVRQNRWAWPNSFRQSRFITAVEYIQANRFRYLLVQEMDQLMKNYDLIVTPSYGGAQLLITNLTGHPCVVIPNGYDDNGSPTSISFIGNLFGEGIILSVANQYQRVTPFENEHPEHFINN
jgi:Asp-tRNA(Asn)/Glu-tRNA(Gln) amidotransferase A subunit family amidase